MGDLSSNDCNDISSNDISMKEIAYLDVLLT